MVNVVGRDDRFKYRATCANCASILEYYEMEITKTYVRDYGGGSDAYHYIHCPTCANQVEVTYRNRK